MEKQTVQGRAALITQAHMVEFAGSEMLTLELAEALAERGFAATVFSPTVGDPVAGLARQRDVRLTDQDEPLAQQRFDLLWIHHFVIPPPVLPQVGEGDATVVFAHMSPFEPTELPVLADVEANLADVIVANSDETSRELRSFGLGDAPIVVLGNPAPDPFWLCEAQPREGLHTLLVVSNHTVRELDLGLDRLQRQGIVIDRIGGRGRIVPVTPQDICAADAVVTVGKTVQYALAIGRPVFCYDIHGGPGWLTPDNLAPARWHNFSGRPFERMDADQIARSVTAGYERAVADADTLRKAIADLTWNDRLEAVLQTARHAERRRRPASEPEVRRVHAYSALMRHCAREHQELTEHTVALHRAQEAVVDLTNEVHELRQQMRSVEASTSWRLTAPLRRSAGSLCHFKQVVSGRLKRSRDSAPL